MELVIALLVAGALLFVAEIYLPGFIAAKFGTVSLIAAVIVAYLQFGVTGASWALLAAAVIVGVGGIAFLNFFSRTGVASGIVSNRVSPTPPPAHLELLNQVGETLSPLRPGGTARFGQERIDVVSDGSPIDAGQAVRVVAVEGHRVVVRADTAVV